jgi:hypothetical protein
MAMTRVTLRTRARVMRGMGRVTFCLAHFDVTSFSRVVYHYVGISCMRMRVCVCTRTYITAFGMHA